MEATTCPNLQVCCKTTNLKPKFNCESFNVPRKCGFHNAKGIGGLVTSMQNTTLYAQYAEFPWMMAILVQRSTAKKYLCGGSLIHPKVVLTTAHNVAGVNPAKLIVRGGEWNTQTEIEICPVVEKKVKQVIRHEDFDDNGKFHNDLALFVLKEEFKMTAFINTVCLPPPALNFDSENCIAVGWGKDKFGEEGIRQVILKKLILPVVSKAKCQSQLRKTVLGGDYLVHNKTLCAGGEKGVDVCSGDGGSPLMCFIEDNPNYLYQVGIAVAGIKCGQNNVPGLYTDVTKYRDWIGKKMDFLNIGTDSYLFKLL